MVGVSLSSVSLWVRDIELTPEARVALQERNPARNGEIVRAANLARARAPRKVWQEAGREHARRGDPPHQIGCMLYWAEGAKSRTAIQFCNSDPAMVALFVAFLRSCYDAPVEAIGLRAHLYADHEAEQKRIEEFWLSVARLPRSCLRRSIVNKVSKSSKGKRIGRLPHGTCRVTFHRAAVVQSIFGAIQEYGGFERPEWLG